MTIQTLAYRIAGERANVRAMIRALAAQGWKGVRVTAGEEQILELKGSREVSLMDAIFAVDEALVTFRLDNTETEALDAPARPRHSVLVVLGNSPEEVVADWGYAKEDADGFNALMEEVIGKF